jgi:hypothetical protein
MGVFTTAAAQFSFSETTEKELEQLREEFVQKFPVSKMSELTLEQYALGNEANKETFCWWLEFKTIQIARISGYSSQHIIFYSLKKQQYEFDSRYPTKEAAFEAVRIGLVDLLRFAAAEEFEKLEKVAPFEGRNLTRGKILYLYYPDKFLPICSVEHLKDFCLQFGVEADFSSQVSMNRALLKFKLSRRKWQIGQTRSLWHSCTRNSHPKLSSGRLRRGLKRRSGMIA